MKQWKIEHIKRNVEYEILSFILIFMVAFDDYKLVFKKGHYFLWVKKHFCRFFAASGDALLLKRWLYK